MSQACQVSFLSKAALAPSVPPHRPGHLSPASPALLSGAPRDNFNSIHTRLFLHPLSTQQVEWYFQNGSNHVSLQPKIPH